MYSSAAAAGVGVGVGQYNPVGVGASAAAAAVGFPHTTTDWHHRFNPSLIGESSENYNGQSKCSICDILA